ncbi:hypothetical protein G9A89_007894 [Geosiphon pyriformis]|nr:hypothetical protein G9A89_007894 [Geosiphon pyriformis]
MMSKKINKPIPNALLTITACLFASLGLIHGIIYIITRRNIRTEPLPEEEPPTREQIQPEISKIKFENLSDYEELNLGINITRGQKNGHYFEIPTPTVIIDSYLTDQPKDFIQPTSGIQTSNEEGMIITGLGISRPQYPRLERSSSREPLLSEDQQEN